MIHFLEFSGKQGQAIRVKILHFGVTGKRECPNFMYPPVSSQAPDWEYVHLAGRTCKDRKISIMSIQYFILITHSLFAIDFNECSHNRDSTKVTVIGTAIVIKNQAAVLTDDSLLYYLDGIGNWDVKYKGKRVKVTGRLVTLNDPVLKHPDPDITISLQPRLRDGMIIKMIKVRLV